MESERTLPPERARQKTLLEHDEHFHNTEYWFGKSADQSGNNWGTRDLLTPYQAISGNNDFGSDLNDEAKVLGSDDTPVVAGKNEIDIRRILIVDCSAITPYFIRLVHGTGTFAAAVAAGQYTTAMYIKESAAGRGSPFDIIQLKIPAGHKVWVSIKNATDNATLDFYVGVHEY
jgi:hypothetical protein